MGGFSNSFLPGESLGMPDDDQNPLWRLLNSLPGRDEYGNQIPNLGGNVRTPPFNPNPPAPVTAAAKQPGSSKLEKLMMFLLPAGSGFIASQFGRRRDRMRNFIAGVAGGGLNVLQDVATRKTRQQAAQKLAIAEAIKEKRAAEAHTADISYKTAQTEHLRKPTVEKPKYELKERKLSDGSTVVERVNVDTGEAIPVTTEEAASPAPPLVGVGPGTPVTRRVPFGSAPAPAKPENLSDFEQMFQRQFGRLPTLKDKTEYELAGEEGKAKIRKKYEKPSAGEERKQEQGEVRQFTDRAAARARKKVQDFDKLEPEEQINAIQDAAREMAGADPDNLRPLLRDVLGEIDAVVRRRRPPAKSNDARQMERGRKATGVR